MTKKTVLVCTICLNRNYTFFKGQYERQEKLKLKKFCKHCNAHTLHEQSR